MGWSGTRRQGGTTQRANSAAPSPEPALDDYAAWQRGAGGESSSGGRLISWRRFRAPLCSRVISAGAALALSSPPSARLPNETLPPAAAFLFFFFTFFFAERLDTMRARGETRGCRVKAHGKQRGATSK